MTSPIQPDKTYGVLHTENFFSFLGFAKKIDSEDIQKIDIYLDDKKIDTIVADEFIQKMDDIYDIESKAFRYNLPNKYIGEKAIISFKNHDSGEELLNSPYTLIDKNHEKFNEAKFLQSLNEPLSDELKNMYKPNCVGFLATKENLEDEEFVGYIKELMERFPDVEFVGFCFDKFNNNLISLKIIEIKCAGEIIPNIEIFIANSKIKDIQLSNKIFNKNHKITTFNYSKANDTFNPNTIYHENPLIKFHKNFSITEEDLKSVNNNLNLIMHNLICKKLGIDIKIQNYNQSTNNFWKEVFINYSLQNKNYKELLWETRTDIAKMRQS